MTKMVINSTSHVPDGMNQLSYLDIAESRYLCLSRAVHVQGDIQSKSGNCNKQSPALFFGHRNASFSLPNTCLKQGPKAPCRIPSGCQAQSH